MMILLRNPAGAVSHRAQQSPTRRSTAAQIQTLDWRIASHTSDDVVT